MICFVYVECIEFWIFMFCVSKFIFVCVFIIWILLNVWMIEMCLYFSGGEIFKVYLLLRMVVMVSFLNLCCDFLVGVRMIWLFGFYVICLIRWSWVVLIFVVEFRCVYVIGICSLWRLSFFLCSVMVLVLNIGIFFEWIWLCRVISVWFGNGLFLVFIWRYLLLVISMFFVCKWREGFFMLNISVFFCIRRNFRIGVFWFNRIVCFFFIVMKVFMNY